MEFSFDRLKQKNITYCAEILEANHTTVKSIMKSWKNSVRHNNILQVDIYKYCMTETWNAKMYKTIYLIFRLQKKQFNKVMKRMPGVRATIMKATNNPTKPRGKK